MNLRLELRDMENPFPIYNSTTSPDIYIGSINGWASIQAMTGDILKESRIGLWAIMMVSGKLELCTTATKLLGIKEDGTASIFSVLRSIEPTDARRMVVALKESCTTMSKMSTEVRLVHPHGHRIRWIRITGEQGHKDPLRSDYIRGIISDITEQKLEEMRKEDYVSLMNHELRSPLTTIKLYIQMAIKQAASMHRAQTTEILRKAEAQTGAMSRMIENFLTTSMVTNQLITIVPETFKMAGLIKEITNEMGSRYPNRNFETGFSDDPAVHADRDKIAQVLVNYLSNAVKYSARGPIKLSCAIDSKFVIVSVTDTGMGICPKDQHKIFQRYFRTNPTGGTKGFGLGLFLAREIIECHGGRAWLESKLGNGSTFSFSLPLSAQSAPN